MVKTLPARSAVRQELVRYLARERSFHELRRCILEHLEAGLPAELGKREWRDFKAEFSYVIDLYTDEGQPRKTGLGPVVFFGRMFARDHRISEEQVRRSVGRLLKWL